jgi:hypothetical protein
MITRIEYALDHICDSLNFVVAGIDDRLFMAGMSSLFIIQNIRVVDLKFFILEAVDV